MPQAIVVGLLLLGLFGHSHRRDDRYSSGDSHSHEQQIDVFYPCANKTTYEELQSNLGDKWFETLLNCKDDDDGFSFSTGNSMTHKILKDLSVEKDFCTPDTTTYEELQNLFGDKWFKALLHCEDKTLAKNLIQESSCNRETTTHEGLRTLFEDEWFRALIYCEDKALTEKILNEEILVGFEEREGWYCGTEERKKLKGKTSQELIDLVADSGDKWFKHLSFCSNSNCKEQDEQRINHILEGDIDLFADLLTEYHLIEAVTEPYVDTILLDLPKCLFDEILIRAGGGPLFHEPLVIRRTFQFFEKHYLKEI